MKMTFQPKKRSRALCGLFFYLKLFMERKFRQIMKERMDS